MNYGKLWASMLVLLAITAIGWSFSATPQDQPPPDDLLNAWLWQFEDEEIVVVFDKPIPQLGRAIKGRLMRVEVSGIVLRWNKKEKFYPFSNILWIAPATEVKWGILVNELTKDKGR